MKKLLIITIGIFAALVAVSQENSSEQFTIPLTSPGERMRLELDHMNGNITVVGYSGKEVIVKATSTGYASDHDDCGGCGHDVQVNVDIDNGKNKEKNKDKGIPSGMKRISVNPLELRAEERDNVVEIHTESWKRRMNLEIKVPINADLELHTVHGFIEVSNVNGTMEINGVNGGMSLTNISGSVLANTVNGDVSVTFKTLAKEVPMSFVTLNGDVDVTLPASVKATAKLRSDQGEIYTDFDMAMERSKTDVKKQNGQYELSINSWVYGKINGGGPEYTFKNMHGNIIVRKGS
ncbi:MAG: DUF4097 family beta strand repeat-containing protein [Cyclobacteriaceae bacterium]